MWIGHPTSLEHHIYYLLSFAFVTYSHLDRSSRHYTCWRVARPLIQNLWVPRPSMLEGRAFYRCHPDQGIGNQSKNPPLKRVKDGASKLQNLSKAGPPNLR